MRKPCYRFEKDLLVLAHVSREGDDSWNSCKAHISRGKSFSITKVSRAFATKVGWFDIKKRTCQPKSRGRVDQPPEQFSCCLAVGGCQIETIIEMTEDPVLFESGAPFDMDEWQVHIGEADFKVLERKGWDSQIYYLDVVDQRGASRRRPKCPEGCTSFTDALGNGHADCMQYWHGEPATSLAVRIRKHEDEAFRLYERQRYPTCEQAAERPSAELLMYVHDVLGLRWYSDTCAAAAAADSIECLSYAHCLGCHWGGKDVCSSAAAAGSMTCLLYAREHGCEWDSRTCAAAARHGSMPCLVYAHKHGCQWDEETCRAATMYGHLECLVYARAHGCPWDEGACSGAAAKGNLAMLAYAHENGCPWNEVTCREAASAGSLECLVYAHERGCPWDVYTCSRAAGCGSLQCLRYAHEQGCCWTEFTCSEAASAGSLDCLMYAHRHGCPYTAAPTHSEPIWKDLSRAAVKEGISLPCLKYVHEEMGCIWDPCGTEWQWALFNGRCDMLEYIHLHGGGWCGEEQLLEMDKQLILGSWGGKLEGRARCLLYMHCCGGCELPLSRGKEVGELVLALMQKRRTAVLLNFHVAGRPRAGSRSADAAHAAMAMLPADIIKQIVCTAKLIIAEQKCS